MDQLKEGITGFEKRQKSHFIEIFRSFLIASITLLDYSLERDHSHRLPCHSLFIICSSPTNYKGESH
jgi:hypothetical protein